MPTIPSSAVRRACAALACLLLAAPALAVTYKWVDANGRVVYSDQPPPPGIKAEIVTAVPPPADPAAAKDLAAKESEFKKRQLDRAEEAQKADDARTEAQRRNAACVQARGRLQTLRDEAAALYRINEQGERVYMDPAARRLEIQNQQKWLRENCTD